MVENEKMNINIMERLVFFLNSEFKNASKYLESKNADYLKLIKFQKEKDIEYESEINSLKLFKENELQNGINYKVEKANLEEEINEMKEKLEKALKEYNKETKLLKDQLSILEDTLNLEKRNNNNLSEENKYKDSIIDEKEKSIAQLLNQMADVDTEIEHNEMLRNELNLLQEEILIYKKKLKESTYLEQEIKSKVIQLEEALSKEIKEKKKIIDENQNLIKENENLTLDQ